MARLLLRDHRNQPSLPQNEHAFARHYQIQTPNHSSGQMQHPHDGSPNLGRRLGGHQNHLIHCPEESTIILILHVPYVETENLLPL